MTILRYTDSLLYMLVHYAMPNGLAYVAWIRKKDLVIRWSNHPFLDDETKSNIRAFVYNCREWEEEERLERIKEENEEMDVIGYSCKGCGEETEDASDFIDGMCNMCVALNNAHNHLDSIGY